MMDSQTCAATATPTARVPDPGRPVAMALSAHSLKLATMVMPMLAVAAMPIVRAQGAAPHVGTALLALNWNFATMETAMKMMVAQASAPILSAEMDS